jgi:glycosyltransferase involved in cell wall biosynthesis
MLRLVSVVIPVRNGKYLAEAVRSVQASTQAEPPVNIEVIVVNNGSTDGSLSLAQSLGAQVLDEPKPGAAHARNRGVSAARGEFLAFLDADDLWAPGKLSRQLHELDTRSSLDMVFTHGENFFSPELTEAQRAAVVCEPGTRPFIIPSAMLARRESFLRAGPLPDLREGEFIAWYGIALAMGLQSEVIPEPLIKRRVHLANSTRLASHPADLLRAAKMVLDRKKDPGGAP